MPKTDSVFEELVRIFLTELPPSGIGAAGVGHASPTVGVKPVGSVSAGGLGRAR